MISRGRIGLRVRSITSFESGTPADVKAMVDLLVLIEAVDKIGTERLDRLKATAHEYRRSARSPSRLRGCVSRSTR
jgi:hypothetical protein